MTSAGRNDLKWVFGVHHFCTVFLYAIFQLSLFMNLYVLLSREDTLFYLRIYHSIIALLMFCCALVEIEFLIRTRKLGKLEEPHEIPGPALVGAVVLTIGIVLGYLYFIVYNYAFQSCDKLVDAIYSSELWLEACYDVLMALFSAISLIYVLQRRYYGAINSNLDKIGRLFINITFSIVWIKVVVFKGYLSHQELCQRKELEGYWCPVTRRIYECSPSSDLHGTQKMWYYVNKAILSSSIIACASEFFPVLLVSHWLACGGAEEKAEDIQRRHQLRLGVRGLLKEFFKDISRVYASSSGYNAPPLKIRAFTFWFFWILTPLAALAAGLRWMVYFYWTIDFDHLMEIHWLTNDYMSLISATLQLALFIGLYAFARSLSSDRLDAHHKAHARGDISILFGCCVVLFVKLASQWLQYLSLRRILAMSDRDCRATKRFLPFVGVGALLMAWVHFGVTFFDTSLIKFSETTLVCMIFTQTIFPADYLFAFTASGCYLELLQRYLNMGFFQIGTPHISHASHHDNHHGHHHHEEDSRFEKGPNIATMMHAANIMYRKRMETISETSSEASATSTAKVDEFETKKID
ncbi:unnamed protein product [Nippostrongylus brasiliensis]|uniref:G protein-coupled receptor n=1 Tax=Nippostrongylus brasiliensis TaxID=27835 RepID=A0A0N4YQ26_NIPBR|nr:unnamed protein product [Nippostrongylus brasiliensis]